MAAPASTAAYKVPDWAVKNKQAFLSAASRQLEPSTKPERSPLYMSLPDVQAVAADDLNKAAMSMSVLAAEAKNGIKPPTELPGAAYFKNVENHPDVLSTIISTARATVGFIPSTNGTQLTEAQILDYVTKFNEFLKELDLYYAYIDLIGAGSQTLQNNTIDCSLMIRTITNVLASALNVATTGSGFDALVESTSALITAAVGYVSQTGKATSANFEMLGLPESNEVGEVPSRDPISAVTFTATILSQQQSGKSTSQESTITISSNSYKLKSSAIIAYADYLAGSSITGVNSLRDYVNSSLPQK